MDKIKQYRYKHLESFNYEYGVCLHGVKTVHTHRFSSEVTMVVNVSSLLLEVELNPVVEPDEMVLSALTNKHMLKATRVKVPAIIRYMSSQTHSQIKTACLILVIPEHPIANQ